MTYNTIILTLPFIVSGSSISSSTHLLHYREQAANSRTASRLVRGGSDGIESTPLGHRSVQAQQQQQQQILKRRIPAQPNGHPNIATSSG